MPEPWDAEDALGRSDGEQSEQPAAAPETKVQQREDHKEGAGQQETDDAGGSS